MFNSTSPKRKNITKHATGLPGKIKIGFFLLKNPKPKGLPGLIDTFQNLIAPISFIILIMKSLLPEDAPPEIIIRSQLFLRSDI